MVLTFKCPHCEQELEVDANGGETLECPSCNNVITVPTPDPAAAPVAPPPPPPPPPPVEKHFVVPDHKAPAEALIKKAVRPLDVIAKTGDKTMRIKTVKRSDCLEVGRDKFDEKVSEILENVGQTNIVSINAINYSYMDMNSHAMIQDYGVMIVYKG